MLQVIDHDNHIISDNTGSILSDAGKEIKTGVFSDVPTSGQAGGFQVHAADDALCIAYITVASIYAQTIPSF
jgi:hypothetical protein